MRRRTKESRKAAFRFKQRVPSSLSRRAMKTWRGAVRSGETTWSAVLDAFSYRAGQT